MYILCVLPYSASLPAIQFSYSPWILADLGQQLYQCTAILDLVRTDVVRIAERNSRQLQRCQAVQRSPWPSQTALGRGIRTWHFSLSARLRLS